MRMEEVGDAGDEGDLETGDSVQLRCLLINFAWDEKVRAMKGKKSLQEMLKNPTFIATESKMLNVISLGFKSISPDFIWNVL